MDVPLITEFESTLNQLVGQSCWSAQISGVGSLVSLHFGEKIKRDEPMTHMDYQLTNEERFYRGVFILYVEDCPWRVETPQEVLATWLDENAPGGPMEAAIHRFVGQQVQEVTLIQPGLDLVLQFAEGLTLRIFPDQVDADVGDNYSLTHIDRTYIVAARSTLFVEDE